MLLLALAIPLLTKGQYFHHSSNASSMCVLFISLKYMFLIFSVIKLTAYAQYTVLLCMSVFSEVLAQIISIVL